jgi:hypothetical protein
MIAVLAALPLSCSLLLAKPIAPHDGCRPVSKVEYNAAKRQYLLNSRARCTSEQERSGDGIIGTVLRSSGACNMRDWLVADLSVMDVHFQLWMVLVTALLLVWFAFVWATRHVR